MFNEDRYPDFIQPVSNAYITQLMGHLAYNPSKDIIEIPKDSLIEIVKTQDKAKYQHTIRVMMGLGAAESSVSPRMAIQMQEYCLLISKLKAQGFNVEGEIFTANKLGTKINSLDQMKVYEATTLRHEYIYSYIHEIYPEHKKNIQVTCDSHTFTEDIFENISKLTHLLPMTNSLKRMSAGRSNEVNAKTYAMFHAVQLKVCEAHFQPKKTIIIFGAASEHNFIEPITTASKIIQENMNYRINDRIHILMPYCKVPAYYPTPEEITLGGTITQNYIHQMAKNSKVKTDYQYLATHSLTPFFIDHFNCFSS